ncbi:hypothetical protein [Corynebacterium striatum]|nr:hypothetical protein [Corynebacterium striatum]
MTVATRLNISFNVSPNQIARLNNISGAQARKFEKQNSIQLDADCPAH